LKLSDVLLLVRVLMTDPKPDEPLIPDIAMQYKRDRKKYDDTAREWTRKFAMNKDNANVASTSGEPSEDGNVSGVDFRFVNNKNAF
jgi:hypothetical protein